ncbi:MAG: DUF3458 domain-containing protein, partial [Desulfobulbaceae bacterium]|nr:DUF3458 domain-containing protein [Desulfobulbaceae bacterium]
HTILGEAGFRRGFDLYIQRHDGQAVTCDDFVAAMSDASGVNLEQFKLWYSQAGTPELTVSVSHDPVAATCTLAVAQHCPATPDLPEKKPMHIPLAVRLIGDGGAELPLRLANGNGLVDGILHVREARQEFCFADVAERPLVSLLRNFSAPVKVRYEYADEELAYLLSHDRDPFNRWEAGQRLASRVILGVADALREGRASALSTCFVEAFRALLVDREITDKTCLAQLLTLPAEEYLAEQMAVIDVDNIHAARQFVRRQLARELREEFVALHAAHLDAGPCRLGAVAAGRRRVKNCCLAYLVSLDEAEQYELALAQFRASDNMTDTMGGLVPLAHLANSYREGALAAFHAQWRHDPLVLDKWFAVQATAPLPTTLAEVRRLLDHPDFSIRNPNKVRSLIGAFAGGNPVCFHAKDGAGYRFLADKVLVLDSLNPQVAARMTAALSRWRRYDEGRQALMQAELARIAASASLSRDVYEVVSKSLR